MSQNTTTAQPRTVQTADRGKLDVRALVLLAILLAAGFILNFTVGKAISGISGGMISPEFIISAFCLTILVVRPNIGQALVIGLISAAVIQITTTSPFVDFAAEGIAAMLMAGIVKDLGLINDGATYRTNVEHDNGLCLEGEYAATRLTSITNAAIVK